MASLLLFSKNLDFQLERYDLLFSRVLTGMRLGRILLHFYLWIKSLEETKVFLVFKMERRGGGEDPGTQQNM